MIRISVIITIYTIDKQQEIHFRVVNCISNAKLLINRLCPGISMIRDKASECGGLRERGGMLNPAASNAVLVNTFVLPKEGPLFFSLFSMA